MSATIHIFHNLKECNNMTSDEWEAYTKSLIEQDENNYYKYRELTYQRPNKKNYGRSCRKVRHFIDSFKEYGMGRNDFLCHYEDLGIKDWHYYYWVPVKRRVA